MIPPYHTAILSSTTYAGGFLHFHSSSWCYRLKLPIEQRLDLMCRPLRIRHVSEEPVTISTSRRPQIPPGLRMRTNDRQSEDSDDLHVPGWQPSESDDLVSLVQKKNPMMSNINDDDGSDRNDRYAEIPNTGNRTAACSQNRLSGPNGTTSAHLQPDYQRMEVELGSMRTFNGSRAAGGTRRGYQTIDTSRRSRHEASTSPPRQRPEQRWQRQPDNDIGPSEDYRGGSPPGGMSPLVRFGRERVELTPREAHAVRAPDGEFQASGEQDSMVVNDLSASSESEEKGSQEFEERGRDYLDMSPVAESYERGRWLLGLLVLQSTSSSVLDHYQDLLQEHVVVTLFLTMLVGAGGNAGNQSAIKVIRGLATGRFTADTACALRVIGKQAIVGLMLGAALSAGGLLRVLATEGTTLRDAAAISTSLFLIVMTSVLLGSALPFGLARLGVDPAHAGTTIQVAMDIVGVAVTCVTCSIVLQQLHQVLSPAGF